ncbi:MAG: helix-turn-helix domain-containing protein [Tannerellaceae bacterium]|jgi:hypothetical protein|nr:helix-turn-helix domain-containing protein [Tannerellaceae bacterium]
MQLFETIERAVRIHRLIKLESTGNPDEFAEKLHLKKRQVYNLLDEFRDNGACIRYNRISNSFCYENNFELFLKIDVDSLPDQDQRNRQIFGGLVK